MGFEFNLTFSCDRCSTEIDCGSDFDCVHVEPELPNGWEKDYEGDDALFVHVCDSCVKEIGEGNNDKAI
ncbi:hypothetical protein LCGC14_2715550 [marine sediment metagenome]|uniref:Uncharacterized protein n=1 Tax=marine sediment metagenome TaxID=412755 RepID=A0A0F9BKP4_9ZZZZ